MRAGGNANRTGKQPIVEVDLAGRAVLRGQLAQGFDCVTACRPTATLVDHHPEPLPVRVDGTADRAGRVDQLTNLLRGGDERVLEAPQAGGVAAGIEEARHSPPLVFVLDRLAVGDEQEDGEEHRDRNQQRHLDDRTPRAMRGESAPAAHRLRSSQPD